MTIAERLQRLIADQGHSINGVAELAGMGPMQAWRIISGKVPNPGVLTLQRLVEAAGSSMVEFFADED